MKKTITLSLMLVMSASIANAQDCGNVVDGAGMNVLASNGLPVIAPNLGSLSDCGDGAIADTDGDGIPDTEDHCPEEVGIAKNYGCPDLNEDEKAVLANALTGVNFVSGKDLLTEESKPKLHAVTELLKAHKDFKLKVSGYTDNTGNEAMNLDLSKKRATAVKNYLVNDGIDANRIESNGYGIANPIADNSTSEGRAKNRRVEFDIVY